MDIIKNLRFYDSRVTPEDCQKADQLHHKMNQRFESEPVFRSVRATLDAADKLHPLSADTAHASTSIREIQRETMATLRANLKAIRSTNTFQNFNESVPISATESRIRGSFNTDVINEEKRAPSKTSVNINARPLNEAASRIRREKFVKDYGYNWNAGGEGDVDYYGKVTALLRADITPEQESKILRIIKCLIPWNDDDAKRVGEVIKAKLTALESEKTEQEEGTELNEDDFFTEDLIPKCDFFAPNIVTGADGRKYLEMTGVFRESRKDLLQTVILKVASGILEERYLDTSDETRIMDLVPHLFRIATARVEFPGNLFQDFLNSPTEKSWMSIVEGLRVNWDLILSRQFFEELLVADLAKDLTKSFDKEDLLRKLVSMAGASFFSDVALQVAQAPPELSFGTLVKEAGHAGRRTGEAVDPEGVRDDEAKQAFARKFTGAGYENQVASFVGSFMRIGVTNSYLKERATLASALAPLLHNKEGKDAGGSIPESQDALTAYFISILQELLHNSVEEIQSVNVVGHSGEIDAEFVGLDKSVWGFLPSTSQEMLNAAKPVILAHNKDYNQFTEDPPQFVEVNMIDFSETHPNKGVFKDRVEKEVTTLWVGQSGSYRDQYLGSMFVAERSKAKRNTMFTVCVACSNSQDDEEWAKLLSLFGVQPLGLKSQKEKKNKKDGDDEGSNDDDDDDEDEILGFPSSTEGYCRSAYVKRKSDGRCFQFIRPVCDEENNIDRSVGITFIDSVDAVIVVNSLKECPWLWKPAGSSSRYRSSFDASLVAQPPTLFVNTTPGAASPTQVEMDRLNRRREALYTPGVTRGATFPGSIAEADGLLDWLIQNSANPQRGVAGAQPAQSFDWPIEDPFMLA